ncbi:MAG: hydroxyacid dehydrogenase [Flavobacteriales bacterium TMED191]|nr:MAG: hydroxyacid dehydrogenase [Flavobacteriales bacterium TMED191]
MKILITDKIDPILLELLDKHNIIYEYAINDSLKTVLNKLHLFTGLIVRNRMQIDNSFLKQAKNLKFIARYGSGMESINVKKAEEMGIKCFNSAEGNSNAVAEHSLGLLLCLLNNIYKSMSELKNKKWNRENNRGYEIEEKTIGIIGYGNTGSAFAKKLYNFNCKIIAYDKYKSGFSNPFVEEVDMKSIYQNSDVISLHIPLNKETFHLFDKKFIRKMKKKFYFINTSRGKIVNSGDLVSGLKSNKIIGAGLDVHESEDKTFSKLVFNQNINYLLNCNNVIMTPHIAGLTKEANKKIPSILIKKIIQFK